MHQTSSEILKSEILPTFHIKDASFQNSQDGSNFDMSKPAFAPDRREIWFSDGGTGFYVVRVDKSVWPASASTTPRK